MLDSSRSRLTTIGSRFLLSVASVRARRTATGGWVVQLTDAPLDLDNPAHLDTLNRSYERFPDIGGRSTP